MVPQSETDKATKMKKEKVTAKTFDPNVVSSTDLMKADKGELVKIIFQLTMKLHNVKRGDV